MNESMNEMIYEMSHILNCDNVKVKVVGSIPTLVRVFLCPCVGPFPSEGLTLTWFIWDRKSSTTHYSLFS